MSDFADRLRVLEPVAGGWVSVGHPVVAELLAEQEFDFLVLDGEHSENSIESLAAMVRAVDAADGDTEALVRVPAADPIAVKRVLDLGPAGVIVPAVDTPEEAAAMVDAAAYPPEGVRGVAGTRPSGYGASLDEYYTRANADTLVIVQIETASAVECVHDIAAVEGLDGLFIGPADLSAQLGVFGEFDSETFRDATDRIADAANDADKPLGTLATSRETVESRWEWGVDFLAVGTDTNYLADAAADYLDAYEDART
ncbi:HpcH/HpaI aldolase family protein [Halocalculus aciditolerans]|uniref:5-keto-4-deoxy-D-glucarate aldolase n=1 Tax=Halocalculus aciditolerans TaxID=1383812 RepID=A0A830F2S1_9EURY|nr:aldolase/citrate lyase family protein [Halocalculus aciditolerans]GGL57009.1 5-keto-4-deoxy-D-glucarate aldolase [Halocalculus aciditolerans]